MLEIFMFGQQTENKRRIQNIFTFVLKCHARHAQFPHGQFIYAVLYISVGILSVVQEESPFIHYQFLQLNSELLLL